MNREEFEARARRDGGYHIRVRLIPTEDGGRQTPLWGDTEYRANWSVESSDPHRQAGAPIFLDVETLSPGQEATAILVPLFPEAFPTLSVGMSLTAFEGHRAVAHATVTDVIESELR